MRKQIIKSEKLNTKELEVLVADFFNVRTHLIVPNVSWGFGLQYEADLVVVTKSNYIYEVELKVSKSDLKADAKKRKHLHPRKTFKRMYYAMPESIYDPTLVPEYAGVLLAYMHRKRWYIKVERKPENLKVDPITDKQYIKLLELMAMRVWSMKKSNLRKLK